MVWPLICVDSASDNVGDGASISHGEAVSEFREEYIPNEQGKCQLKHDSPSNAAFLGYEGWLNESIIALDSLDITSADTSMVKRTFRKKLRDELKKIWSLKYEEWRRQNELGRPFGTARVNPDGEIVIDTSE